MTLRSITTSHGVLACDVCGRTLLRGESAEAFIADGTRRLVCELCTSRAANEGWIREGADDVGVRRSDGRRRRSLLGRLRRHGDGAEVVRARTTRPIRERAERQPAESAEPAPVDEEPGWGAARNHHDDAGPHGQVPEAAGWEEPATASSGAAPLAPAHGPPGADDVPLAPDEGDAFAPDEADALAPANSRSQEPRRERRWRWRGETAAEPPRAHRDVHAVPTNASLKLARALEVFNASGHPRTVAGIARSLGEPIVAAHPSVTEGSIVVIVVGWELCWYRYEVDLADEAAGVRVVAQGVELDELQPHEQEANAQADDRGWLALL